MFAGAAYALFIYFTGLGIPCVFHKITTLWCPGCGISRMILSVLKLDIYAAFRCNPFLFVTLPLFLMAVARKLWVYLKYESPINDKWLDRCLLVYAAALVIFGILRNIPALDFLAPQ